MIQNNYYLKKGLNENINTMKQPVSCCKDYGKVVNIPLDTLT